MKFINYILFTALPLMAVAAGTGEYRAPAKTHGLLGLAIVVVILIILCILFLILRKKS